MTNQEWIEGIGQTAEDAITARRIQRDHSCVLAIKMLGQLTHGRFDVYALAGPSMVRARQSLMLALTGQKLPQSKCGVNAISAKFGELCNITGDCIAAREDNLAEYCRNLLASEVTR